MMAGVQKSSDAEATIGSSGVDEARDVIGNVVAGNDLEGTPESKMAGPMANIESFSLREGMKGASSMRGEGG